MTALLRRDGADCGAIVCILLAYVALLVVVPPSGEFPTTDDFDYAATAWHLADHGRLTLSDWPAMTLITHVAWGALACKLFGNSFAVLRCSICLLSFIGAVAIYWGFRRREHSRPLAVLAALGFALNPLVVSLQYTFMTDVTGAALAAVLIACAPDPRQTSTARLIGYSAVGGLAYLARETAAIPWIIVLLAASWGCVQRRCSWRTVLCLAAPAGLMIAAYQFWLHEFDDVPFNRSQPSLALSALLQDPQRPLYLVTGLALAVAPLSVVAVLCLVRARSPRWWLLPVAAGLSGLVLVCVGLNVTPPYRDEIFDLGLRLPESPIGLVPASLKGPTVVLFQNDVSLVRLLATGTSWCLAAILGATLVGIRRTSSEHPATDGTRLPVATLTTVAMVALYLFTRGFSDRYLLSLIAPALLMLAEQIPSGSDTRNARAFGWTTAMLMAAVSLVGIQDAMTRSRAFFTAAQQVQRRVDPFDVDAGIAFGGMFRFNPIYRGESNRGPFWNSVPPAERSTAIAPIHPLTTTLNRKYRISFDAAELGYDPLARVLWKSWFRSGEVTIFERRDAPPN